MNLQEEEEEEEEKEVNGDNGHSPLTSSICNRSYWPLSK